MKIGFACGVYDLFHAGHKHFLRNCAIRCNYLIVAVNHDRWCQRKGPARPFDELLIRMDHVETLLCSELGRDRFAIIPFSGNDLALAAEIGPDVIFRGWDQRDNETSGTIPVIRIGRLGDVSTTLLAQQRNPK